MVQWRVNPSIRRIVFLRVSMSNRGSVALQPGKQPVVPFAQGECQTLLDARLDTLEACQHRTSIAYAVHDLCEKLSAD